MLANFTKVILRRLRLVKINRNFLVFLIFFVISIVFWFMQSVKETSEVSLTYKLNIVDMPKDIIYTTDMPQEVSVSYASKGWNAFYYKFMINEVRELTISFKEIDNGNGEIIIDANNFRRAAQKVKPTGMTYKSTIPNKIEAFYSNGQHKRVPVTFKSSISTTGGRFHCGTILSPDSVDVYAPEDIYKNITSIETENIAYKEVEDTINTRLALVEPRGVKVFPDTINAEICVDIFTDKIVLVPVQCENVPPNKIMRSFPLKAKIIFLVSSTLYDEITAEDFVLAADYEDVKKGTDYCKLYVRQQPSNIRNLRISPEAVEYVIEQASE